MPRVKHVPSQPTTAQLVAEAVATSPVVRYTLQEANNQLAYVEDLVIEGAAHSQITRLVQLRFPSVTKLRVKSLLDRVKERHAKEDAEARAEWKSAQIRRLHQYRRECAGIPNLDANGNRISWQVKPDHKARVAYERLLAQICGTLEPVAVNVDVRYTEAMLSVVAQMTGEDAAEYLAEALEQERLAGVARRLLPAHVVEAETDSRESEEGTAAE